MTRSTPLHGPGGFEKYIFDLAFGLTARGHEIHIITKRLPRKRIRKEVTQLNGVHLHFVGPRATFFWYSFPFFFEMGKKLAELQNAHRFDVIHSNNLAAFSMFLVRPTEYWPPLIATAHGTSISEFLTHTKTIFQKVYRSFRFLPVIPPEYVTFWRSKTIICISPHVQKQVEQMNPKFGKKCTVIHNGINTSLFHPIEQVASDPNAPVTILFTGTISSSKGVPRLYQAFKLLAGTYPRLRLRLVGGGPLYDSLKAEVHADSMRDRVRLDGPLSPENMPEIYRQSQIFVLPTESQEGLSFSILEALASGLPVIASTACHMEHIFTKYQAGLTYKAGDAKMLAKLVELLLNDPLLRQKLGASGQTLIMQKFRDEMMIQKVENVYKKVIRV